MKNVELYFVWIGMRDAFAIFGLFATLVMFIVGGMLAYDRYLGPCGDIEERAHPFAACTISARRVSDAMSTFMHHMEEDGIAPDHLQLGAMP